MKTLVDELVRAVDAAWSTVGFDPAAFPAIAAGVLERAEAHRRVGLPELLAWLGEEGELPPQDLASGFGEPPLTLYAGERWAIQLLAWLDGRTTIHEHDFAGAFTVLAGSSIQRRFTFASQIDDAARLRIGRLELSDLTLLEQGAVSPIAPGSALVHSVFHLDRPTLSLVIRTDGGLLEGPQYDYWAPWVALDPEHVEPRAARQQQTLALLLRAGAEWQPFAAGLLERAHLHQTFRLLDLLLGMHDGGDLPPPLLEIASRRHGASAIERILEALHQGRWEHALTVRRAALTNAEHRFFLGALVTAPDREAVLELVGRRYPDALASVRRWIGELVAGESPHLEALCVRMASALMEGRSRAEVSAELAASGGDRVRLLGDPVAFCEQLRGGVLRPLFRSRYDASTGQ